MPQLAAVPEQAVLVLDLSEGLIERRPDSPLARASLGGTLVLREVVEALDAAGDDERVKGLVIRARSEEHTSELQSLMRISYAVFCLNKKHKKRPTRQYHFIKPETHYIEYDNNH